MINWIIFGFGIVAMSCFIIGAGTLGWMLFLGDVTLNSLGSSIMLGMLGMTSSIPFIWLIAMVLQLEIRKKGP